MLGIEPSVPGLMLMQTRLVESQEIVAQNRRLRELHSIVLVPKRPQPNKSRRLHELILDPFRPAHSKVYSNIVPDLPVVETPPLPSTVLAPETLDYLPAAGMLRYVTRAVQNDVVDHNDCPRQLVREWAVVW